MINKMKLNSTWSAYPGVWFSIIAIIAFLWNTVGAIQFINSIMTNSMNMMGSSMNAEQMAVMIGLPLWVTFIFGLGVITSLIGSVLLYLRNSYTTITLTISLISFILLSIAYIIYDVFRVIGTSQIVIMSFVVIIAIALVILSMKIKK
jgi:hypothetical protein